MVWVLASGYCIVHFRTWAIGKTSCTSLGPPTGSFHTCSSHRYRWGTGPGSLQRDHRLFLPFIIWRLRTQSHKLCGISTGSKIILKYSHAWAIRSSRFFISIHVLSMNFIVIIRGHDIWFGFEDYFERWFQWGHGEFLNSRIRDRTLFEMVKSIRFVSYQDAVVHQQGVASFNYRIMINGSRPNNAVDFANNRTTLIMKSIENDKHLTGNFRW